MPRKPIHLTAMTDAERQARRRAARAVGKPATRARHPIDRRSRAQRWRDAVAELTAFQASYAEWFDSRARQVAAGASPPPHLGEPDIRLSRSTESTRLARPGSPAVRIA